MTDPNVNFIVFELGKGPIIDVMFLSLLSKSSGPEQLQDYPYDPDPPDEDPDEGETS
jgi:hypothetical protein